MVVVLAVGKSCDFVQKLLQPWSLFWEIDKTVFDGAADRMKTHDLVHSWFVGLSRVNPFPNQLL